MIKILAFAVAILTLSGCSTTEEALSLSDMQGTGFLVHLAVNKDTSAIVSESSVFISSVNLDEATALREGVTICGLGFHLEDNLYKPAFTQSIDHTKLTADEIKTVSDYNACLKGYAQDHNISHVII